MEISIQTGLIVTVCCIVLYIFYHLISFVSPFRNWILNDKVHQEAAVSAVLLQRLAGFAIMGGGSLLLMLFVFHFPVKEFGLSAWDNNIFLWWFAIAILILPLSYMNARKDDNLAMYPQMRFEKWSIGKLIMSNLTWMLYLLGYEFMFRGLLFFALYYSVGLLPAIAMNTVLYALAHVPKNMKETLGSIPMGILLCIITYYTGSFWAAFLIHCTMALSNEYFSIIKHPKMSLVGRISV